MVKAIIPNVDGHYEMNGIEIDVSARQIIVRTDAGRHPGRENQPKQDRVKQNGPVNKDNESMFGPVTTGILQKVGLLDTHKK